MTMEDHELKNALVSHTANDAFRQIGMTLPKVALLDDGFGGGTPGLAVAERLEALDVPLSLLS